MIESYETKILKINKPVRGYKPGDEVPVRCDENGTPLDLVWRRRLKDAEQDSCVELLEEKKKKKVKNDTEIKKPETKNTEEND